MDITSHCVHVFLCVCLVEQCSSSCDSAAVEGIQAEMWERQEPFRTWKQRRSSKDKIKVCQAGSSSNSYPGKTEFIRVPFCSLTNGGADFKAWMRLQHALKGSIWFYVFCDSLRQWVFISISKIQRSYALSNIFLFIDIMDRIQFATHLSAKLWEKFSAKSHLPAAVISLPRSRQMLPPLASVVIFITTQIQTLVTVSSHPPTCLLFNHTSIKQPSEDRWRRELSNLLICNCAKSLASGFVLKTSALWRIWRNGGASHYCWKLLLWFGLNQNEIVFGISAFCHCCNLIRHCRTCHHIIKNLTRIFQRCGLELESLFTSIFISRLYIWWRLILATFKKQTTQRFS